MARAYLTGCEELIAKLNAIGKVKAKSGIRKGSRAASKLVLAEAMAKAPVKTGALRAALKVRALPRSRRWTGTQVTAKGVFYESFIELGTKRMKARSFIREALKSVKSSALAAFIDGIREAIK